MSARAYFKAVRPDGTSFHDPSFRWATEPGGVTSHPDPDLSESAARYLSVSTVPTDCVGFSWPCRLLEVEAVGETAGDGEYAHKVRGVAFRTVREVPAHMALGPQGEHVAALIERAGRLTAQEVGALRAARDAAWAAARDAAWAAAWAATRAAARAAARDAARGAAWAAAWAATRAAAWAATRAAARAAARDAAREAAGDAAWALAVRDVLDPASYDTLTRPWRTAVGRIHPDDADIAGGAA